MNEVQKLAREIANRLQAQPDLWTQGKYGCYKDDTPGCLMGQLRWVYFREHKGEPAGIVADNVSELMRRFTDEFHAVTGLYSPISWNDDPARTPAEVIAVCNRIAGDQPADLHPCPEPTRTGPPDWEKLATKPYREVTLIDTDLRRVATV